MSIQKPVVKICGIRSPEAARIAVESGAAMLGLVFYPPSPRYLAAEEAARLLETVEQLSRRPALVGLFVNAGIEELAGTTRSYHLDYLQLSGDETPAQVAEAARLRPVIKTLRLPAQVSPEEALQHAAPFAEVDNVTLLVDTHKPGMYGGTGETGDWSVARELAARYRVLLAGGLNPANVAQAVRQVQPWGVDVSSGVESSPGQKDPVKIKSFCEALEGNL